MKTKDDENLMKELYGIASMKKNIIKGNQVYQMRKEIVPAISRKIILVTGSEAWMIRTKAQAQFLINYYKTQND
jgi:hypothetical protein